MFYHKTLGKVEITGWLKANPREKTVKVLDKNENVIAVIERREIDMMLSPLESQQTAVILKQIQEEDL